MRYHNPIHCVAPPLAGLGVRQHLRRRKSWNLPGGTTLWCVASKITLGLGIVFFGLNMWIGGAVTDAVRAVEAVEATRHALKDEQIVLLAERASLMSSREVLRLAESKLALYVPEEGQVYRLR